MIENLIVGLEQRSYPITIGDGILDQIGNCLSSVNFPKRIAVITNSEIGSLYFRSLGKSLLENGFVVELIEIPEGESAKNLNTLNQIFEQLIKGKFDRSSGLLALGGGVVGDITGFAAATYLRGIPFVQVPTTLLAQVDSSVGGKTAVNHALGKNLIGAFYQPSLVQVDVRTLQSLPEREYSSGLAEVIKYGIIRDDQFFTWIEDNQSEIRRKDPSVLMQMVKISCQIKADVVEIDERESGLRAILNFGHTYGHAVETLSGYGIVRHGEAVSQGMLVAAAIAREMDLCTIDEIRRIRHLLRSFNLPTRIPEFPIPAILEVMARDKKVKNGVLRLVLNKRIGDCLVREVDNPEELLTRSISVLKSEEE